ncbi:hypothetical protein ZIOFF_032738 [Zingiber officinale]|uniref:G3BP-like protein n=1 Tax=Zingiber officinale TaxID=94328 RepID=A0A8J5L6L2_ZINOF|nr:hypothetical protein ZIOFF_032738 [Zingiber officinale]
MDGVVDAVIVLSLRLWSFVQEPLEHIAFRFIVWKIVEVEVWAIALKILFNSFNTEGVERPVFNTEMEDGVGASTCFLERFGLGEHDARNTFGLPQLLLSISTASRPSSCTFLATAIDEEGIAKRDRSDCRRKGIESGSSSVFFSGFLAYHFLCSFRRNRVADRSSRILKDGFCVPGSRRCGPGKLNRGHRVGAYFLKNYYPILQQKPELVHQFYTELSSMVRFDGTDTESANGMMQIHRLVMCLNFKGIEIKSAHSLESWNGGVLVMVSGYVQLEDYSFRRKFVQTFFLAPQEEGYFVLNDIFHFLEEEHIHQHPAALMPLGDFETNLNVSSPAADTVSVPDYMPGEAQAQDLAPPVHVEEKDTVENYNIVEAPQQLSVSDERLDEPLQDTASYPVALEITREPSPPAAPEEPVGEPTKHTYASILAKGQSGLPMHHPTTIAKASQVGDTKSVYVGNLPSSISISDLEQAFKHFGKLRPEGVSIRSRKESDVFYAFIEYEDAIGVQNALKKEAEAEVTPQSPREGDLVAGFSGKVAAGKTATRGTIQVGPEEIAIPNEFKTGVTSCSSLSFFRLP